MSHFSKIALLALPMLLWGMQANALAAGADDHDRPHAEQRPGPGARDAGTRGHGAERAAGRPAGPGRTAGPGRAAPARPAFDGRGRVLDSRYNHGRYYPRTGTIRSSLPDGYRPYYRGGNRYYFSGGSWYAPRGPGFVVIQPPSGLVISVLPSYYSTVWFGGVPYYYADNVYYTQQPDQSGYAVVDPPADADSPSPPPDNTESDLIVYPKNGQTKDQQAADQFECHSWSKGQTGFDPTQPGGGVSPANADVTRGNYNRAMSACMQARGYQVN